MRIRSAISLAALQPKELQNDRDRRNLGTVPIFAAKMGLSPLELRNLNRATDDFMAAMTARGDDWASYANVGNFYMDRRRFSCCRRLLRDGDEVGAAADRAHG